MITFVEVMFIMGIVTREGLKKAARNLFWLPFRAVLTFFEWLTKILIAVALIGFLATATLGPYYYFVKSNQPMQIDPRYAKTLPPKGMTFRELWQDRFEGWAKIDEQEYKSGKSKSPDACRFTQLVMFPRAHVLDPVEWLLVVRLKPDSSLASTVRKRAIVPPDDMNVVDALWFQIENVTWWFWVDNQAICKLPPPKRPVQASP